MRFHGRRHTHVHDHDPRPNMFGQHVDRRAAAQKIQYHLRGHLLWEGTDPLFHHTMISGHDGHNFMLDARTSLTRNPGQLDGQALQAPQAALRFGEHILPGAGSGHGSLVEGLDARDQ